MSSPIACYYFFAQIFLPRCFKSQTSPTKLITVRSIGKMRTPSSPLLNKRIEASLSEDIDGVLNWSDLLESGFSYDAMKQIFEVYLLLGRPRDVIYYFGRVLFNANRRESVESSETRFRCGIERLLRICVTSSVGRVESTYPRPWRLSSWISGEETEDITNDDLRTEVGVKWR